MPYKYERVFIMRAKLELAKQIKSGEYVFFFCTSTVCHPKFPLLKTTFVCFVSVYRFFFSSFSFVLALKTFILNVRHPIILVLHFLKHYLIEIIFG